MFLQKACTFTHVDKNEALCKVLVEKIRTEVNGDIDYIADSAIGE